MTDHLAALSIGPGGGADGRGRTPLRMRLDATLPHWTSRRTLALSDDAAPRFRRADRLRANLRCSFKSEDGLCRSCCSTPPDVVARRRRCQDSTPVDRPATKASATRGPAHRRGDRRRDARASDGPHGRRLRALIVVLCRRAAHPRAPRAERVRLGPRRTAAAAGVRRRFAPHQIRHAHAVETAHEGVPPIVIQRPLGHSNLGITSIYPQGIDDAEIIGDVHARRAPMVPVSTSLRL